MNKAGFEVALPYYAGQHLSAKLAYYISSLCAYALSSNVFSNCAIRSIHLVLHFLLYSRNDFEETGFIGMRLVEKQQF